jgi:cytochrome c
MSKLLFGIGVSAWAVFYFTFDPTARKSGGSPDEVGQTKNNSPIVKIIEPKSNSVHPLNSLVRYSITVSDREDGESKYDEIPAARIFLEIEFVEGSPESWKGRATGFREEHPGLGHIKNSDCFTCHQFRSRLIGPSFREIATRYSKDSDAGRILASRITAGSKAIWGDAIMPAHPDISQEAAQEIIDWILENGASENLNYLSGKEGSFRLAVPAKAGAGFFVLTASYTDTGSPALPTEALTGKDVAIVRLP